ncbi:hypothetical protein QTQ03_18160 [Micromonospora sp. WMMA1363]|uniref:hypothetical protein n=1 Tax=Micromonospora sp. WMMA1363 TaxID=3053985 RepID=UPI00259C96E3|nr:hypothetical protein [Micromonospora sp. WMMA1363]MDM4721430.1 hypothetical protein [Micromonospora sp. WMMA1363]
MTQQPQQWHSAVTIRRWTQQPTDDQLAEITRTLPGFGIIIDNGADRVRLEMTIEAPTTRQAADTATRAARTAHSQAIGGAPDITALRVITAEDHEREISRPHPMDLVGNAEIARILGVSRQRVEQLAREHDAFPDPVARLAAGPVYTRGSVDAFTNGWQRKPGRPPKTS